MAQITAAMVKELREITGAGMKNIALLGSTGSIGTQTLDVVRANPELFHTAVLAANTSDEQLEQQIREFSPELAVLADPSAARRLKERYTGKTRILGGPEGLLEAAAHPAADTVVTSMKDLYSFDKDEEGLDVSYKKMYDAYTKIFTRCGLEFRPVEADNGAIGGGHSHEFTVLADAGESNIAYCSSCDYAASDEKAELTVIKAPEEEMLPLEKVATPGAKTIELVADYLKVPVEKTIKAVAFQTEKDELVLTFVRGDHEEEPPGPDTFRAHR